MLRRNLTHLRAQADDLLNLPTLPKPPAAIWARVGELDLGRLLRARERAKPTPKYSTRSDTSLWTYTGVVLGVRQLLLHEAYRREEPLPPGFVDAPPAMLALMGVNLTALLDPAADPEGDAYPLFDRERRLVDCWESSALGGWARHVFFAGHVFDRRGREWLPLTPDAEG